MENIASFYYRYLRYIQSKDDTTATCYDKYMALCYAVRGLMVDKWIETQKLYHINNPRRIYYLSMEYIFGKSLKQNIINLGLEKSIAEAAQVLSFSIDEIYKEEDDLELGNAGSGSQAACLLEAAASAGLPAMGYGLRYDYAQFHQQLKDGMQTEKPYDWLHTGHSWEITRPEYACLVNFNGKMLSVSENGVFKQRWTPIENVIAIPHDFPIPGYDNDTVNTLRLWSSKPSDDFLPGYSNHGDYVRACEEKFLTSRITNYLIPDEDYTKATEIRIKQEYFFVSASLQDIIRRYKQHNNNILDIDKKVIIQLNGSRCAIAIPEFMRLMLDQENVSWENAWRIARNVFAYTSHAVTTDQLEMWPIYLMEEIIPRHLKIIFDINQWHLDEIRKKEKYDTSIIRDVSLIEEGEVKWVRLAHLAAIGSSCVNGVSKIQTELLKKKIYRLFHEIVPITIQNKTNGIELRRWLLKANKPLTSFINELIGDSWIKNSQHLSKLEAFAQDTECLARLADIKHTAKRNLAVNIEEIHKIIIDPDMVLHVDCKKIHPGKRQMLQVLYIISQYLALKNGNDNGIPQAHIFGGKATPADYLAKQIIYFINHLATIINNDPQTKNKLQIIFIPDYGITMGERVIPAADISEQLSAPNVEPGGTSNLKFAINGSITIASKAGTNLELAELVGPENIFIFGHTADDSTSLLGYKPNKILETSPLFKEIFNFISEIIPSFKYPNLVHPLLASLRDTDQYGVLLDFEDYCQKQKSIMTLYNDRHQWLSVCLKNIARSGWFSADRMVNEYAQEIWKIDP